MTTTVEVRANHGWPVTVTVVDLRTGNTVTEIVQPNTTRQFYAHSTQDLTIHEVQPNEAGFEHSSGVS